MKTNILVLLATIVALLVLGGCQTPTTTATMDQLQKTYTRERGIVLEVKEFVIDESSGENEGAIVGAIAGAIEGGDDNGIEGAIVGAAAGAIIGHVAENFFETTKAYELVIQRENGGKIVVLQRRNSIKGIQPDEPVFIYTDVEGNTLIHRV
jgi:outer membrane lipoprotein SlyB